MKMKNKILPLAIILFAGLFLGGCSLTDQQQTIVPPASTQQEQVKSDEQLIKEALIAKNGPDFADVTVEVSENTGQFAAGSVGSGPGGGMFFAAKVNGQWFISWDGNGSIFCEDIEPYNFPNTMIPACFDQQTQQLVDR